MYFVNTAGQRFVIIGINDKLAHEDAVKHTEQGRPFDRRNMNRLELFYGVKVKFVPVTRDSEDDGY